MDVGGDLLVGPAGPLRYSGVVNVLETGMAEIVNFGFAVYFLFLFGSVWNHGLYFNGRSTVLYEFNFWDLWAILGDVWVVSRPGETGSTK